MTLIFSLTSELTYFPKMASIGLSTVTFKMIMQMQYQKLTVSFKLLVTIKVSDFKATASARPNLFWHLIFIMGFHPKRLLQCKTILLKPCSTQTTIQTRNISTCLLNNRKVLSLISCNDRLIFREDATTEL